MNFSMDGSHIIQTELSTITMSNIIIKLLQEKSHMPKIYKENHIEKIVIYM
jgi:hypothetical protein